jgi:nucleotide-binding universal stress UspA family protein
MVFNRILIAVDGSEASVRALEKAVDLALQLGSEITVISVIDEMKLPFSAEFGLWARESHDDLIRKVLEDLNSVILEIMEDNPELEVETRIEEGRPAKVIKHLAEIEDFDLIIMGRRGLGLVDHLIMGSVSSEVVRTSTIPVLIVE